MRILRGLASYPPDLRPCVTALGAFDGIHLGHALLITTAVERVSREELGIAVERTALLGAYDHLYEDNFSGRPGVSTHYVVLAYRCRLANGALIKPDEQHSILKWWRPEEIVASAEVHENTKRYFPGGKIESD